MEFRQDIKDILHQVIDDYNDLCDKIYDVEGAGAEKQYNDACKKIEYLSYAIDALDSLDEIERAMF